LRSSLSFTLDRICPGRSSAEKIAAYEEQRITTVSAWTVRNEVTILRHMLNLAHRK